MTTPTGWDTITIDQCCHVLDCKRVPVNAEARQRRIGDVPYYGANGLQGYIDDFIFDEPLILMAEDGGRFDEFATYPIAYRISGKSWVNNHAHVLRAKTGFCQNAIFYSLEHKDIQAFIVGGTRAKLNQRALRSITVQLPVDFEEQSKIAEVLSTMDRAIEQTEALIVKQQRIKTGLMQDLLTKGIDEHGRIRSEETHEFKDSPLGRIPTEWDVSRLDGAVNIVDCMHFTPQYVDEGIPIIRPRNVKIDGLDLTDCDFVSPSDFAVLTDKHVPTKGDIVFSRNASFGIPVYLDSDSSLCIGQDVVVMTRKSALTRYVYYSLLSDYMTRQINVLSAGSTFGRIDLGAIRQLQVALPDPTEQSVIIHQIDLASDAERLEISVLAKYQALKTGLMRDLLSGEVPVTPLLGNTILELTGALDGVH